MDIRATIKDLIAERDKLDQTIRMLEQLEKGKYPVIASRRGRKSMGSEERKEVAERMKQYWAPKRKNAG